MLRKRILEFATYAGMGGTQRMLLEFLRHASRDKYIFYLCVLLGHDMLNEEYYTRKGQEGSPPFAGASGRLVDTLMAAGSIMISEFRNAIEKSLSRAFQRSRNLAAYTIPPDKLITIAAEGDRKDSPL